MQQQLDIATKWCHDNGLVINATKTKLLHIKPRHLADVPIEIKFHDLECLHQRAKNTNNLQDKCTTKIELVTSYKYLGVYIDNNFKWKTHVENVRKQLRKSAYMLYHLSNCATYSVLRQAYFSLAESYIRHGITAWGSASYCRILQKTQNQILKMLWRNQRNFNYTNIDNRANNNVPTNANNLTYNTINSNATQYLTLNMNHLNTPFSNIFSNTTLINQSNNLHPTNTTPINVRSHNMITANNNNIASALNILNVKSIYYSSLANDFFNNNQFLEEINHSYNTRRRAQKRFKVGRFSNEYGKNTLSVTLPSILNKFPLNIMNTKNYYKRKKLIKQFFISSQ